MTKRIGWPRNTFVYPKSYPVSSCLLCGKSADMLIFHPRDFTTKTTQLEHLALCNNCVLTLYRARQTGEDQTIERKG